MSQISIRELPPSTLRAATVAPAAPWQGSLLRLLANRLGVCELRRRLLHMVPGVLPVLLWMIPHADPWGPPLYTIVICLFGGIMTYAITRGEKFARPGETGWHWSVVGYCLPILVMLLAFPGRSELGLMTLGVMAFGDGSAALGGKLFGGRRLPWNRGKTWVGLFCFLVAGTLVGAFNYWVEARPVVSYLVALGIAAPAALLGAFVESLPIRSHDNFRVGITAAVTGIAMHLFILGW